MTRALFSSLINPEEQQEAEDLGPCLLDTPWFYSLQPLRFAARAEAILAWIQTNQHFGLSSSVTEPRLWLSIPEPHQMLDPNLLRTSVLKGYQLTWFKCLQLCSLPSLGQKCFSILAAGNVTPC
ncbi:hypothetical protein WISP_140814 [Willisornis vidua]|uniref:Uncharacterized protein n=1 Tax=Willisornis vidua TaxID=1566151 RepID=A0ABQ9CRG8_9PASS|nr:hypothetical protein WISP_140814 [Willisornis vidua]